jgi:hypothetical protein
MGLSRTTALLDLSLTFPFDHFFFLLLGQCCSAENPLIPNSIDPTDLPFDVMKCDLPSLGTGLRGGSLLGCIISDCSVYSIEKCDLPLLLTWGGILMDKSKR